MSFSNWDAVVIGAGPNGLAAAILLASHGLKVALLEAQAEVGGGLRSAEITLPGFLHDLCASVHPMAVASPFLSTLPLEDHGLRWIHSPAALAHPMDDGSCALQWRDVGETARQFGSDSDAYRHIFQRFVDRWSDLKTDLLSPPGFPRNKMLMASFGSAGLQPATFWTRRKLRTARARGFFAGIAAHSALPLSKMGSTAFGLALGIAGHASGWPIAAGGSRSIARALAGVFESLGGEIFTGTKIERLDEIGSPEAILCDLTPSQLLKMAGPKLSTGFQRAFRRFKYGPAAFKLDWALNGPVPWKSQECSLAATVHLGGSLQEIAASEDAAWTGPRSARPFVLLVQPSLFDASRAPRDRHTLWAYCHVPNGSTIDRSAEIEEQIERFAPGFRSRILARHVTSPLDFERRNPNYAGGDILGGAQTFRQILFRPTLGRYRTGARGLYLCSASTPPGAGIHGMCGYFAAARALWDVFGIDARDVSRLRPPVRAAASTVR